MAREIKHGGGAAIENGGVVFDFDGHQKLTMKKVAKNNFKRTILTQI